MPSSYNGWTAERLIEFEADIAKSFEAGLIKAPIHLHGGNESQLINIFSENKISYKDSYCFGTHRAHYHALLHGIPPELVKREILAGHSISLQFPEYHFFTSAIVGGICPIALGVAMTGQKCWVFIGDMSAHTGIYQDCEVYAMGHNLPLHFVVETNGYSVDTPTCLTWGCDCDHPDTTKQIYSYSRTYPHQGTNKGWVTF